MHVRFGTKSLYRFLSAVTPFACKDDTRPHIHCIRLELLADDRIAIVATDGHRLAVAKLLPTEIVSAKNKTAASISPRVAAALMTELRRYAKSDEHIVDIRTVAGRVSIRHVRSEKPLFEMLLPISTSDFPPYKGLIPKAPEAPATVALNAKYAASAFAAFDRAATSAAQIPVSVFTKGPLDAVVFRCRAVPELTVVVMPMREDFETTFPRFADKPSLKKKAA